MISPKKLSQMINNARSVAGDPHSSPQQLKNRLLEFCHLLERSGWRIYAYEDRTNALLGLMMMRHAERKESVRDTRDFCASCGAGKPPRLGEGTCPKCDPTGALRNPQNTTPLGLLEGFITATQDKMWGLPVEAQVRLRDFLSDLRALRKDYHL